MTNAQTVSLIRKHEDPNYDRIHSLANDGHTWDEAKRIDELERREAVLLELGARGELDEEERDELDNMQQRLHALVGNGETFVGTAFAGDGHAAGMPTLAAEGHHTCPRCGGEGSTEVSHARGKEEHVCPRCKGGGTLRPIRFDLPFLRTKAVYPLTDDRWRVTYEVRCYAPQSDGYWSLRAPIVEEHNAIYKVLWDAHEQRLHEEAKRDVAKHRAFIEARGDDWEVYAGIRR